MSTSADAARAAGPEADDHRTLARGDAMTGLSSGAELRKHLDRWVAEGLIDTAQATRIETAEAPATGSAAGPGAGPPTTAPPATGSRAPLVAEALGYAGGVLAIA